MHHNLGERLPNRYTSNYGQKVSTVEVKESPLDWSRNPLYNDIGTVIDNGIPPVCFVHIPGFPLDPAVVPLGKGEGVLHHRQERRARLLAYGNDSRQLS